MLDRNNIQEDSSRLTVSGPQSLVVWLHAFGQSITAVGTCWGDISPYGGQAEEREERVYTLQRHALSDPLPPGRPHLLTFSQPPKIALPNGTKNLAFNSKFGKGGNSHSSHNCQVSVFNSAHFWNISLEIVLAFKVKGSVLQGCLPQIQVPVASPWLGPVLLSYRLYLKSSCDSL